MDSPYGEYECPACVFKEFRRIVDSPRSSEPFIVPWLQGIVRILHWLAFDA